MKTDRTRLKCNSSLRHPPGLCRTSDLRKLELIHLAMSDMMELWITMFMCFLLVKSFIIPSSTKEPKGILGLDLLFSKVSK